MCYRARQRKSGQWVEEKWAVGGGKVGSGVEEKWAVVWRKSGQWVEEKWTVVWRKSEWKLILLELLLNVMKTHSIGLSQEGNNIRNEA